MHVALLPRADHEGATGGIARWQFAASCGNPFAERFLVERAAAELAAPGEHIHLLNTDPTAWNALLPLKRLSRTPAGSIWSVWSHVHALDTTPAEADQPEHLLEKLFDFLQGENAVMLRWATLAGDTPFYDALADWLRSKDLEFRVTKQVSRPVLAADAAFGAERLRARLHGKRLREFGRMRRRLSELGELTLSVHDGRHDADEWLGDFTAIEASGWKGEKGTAIGCNPHERAWFGAVARRAALEGRMLVYALELDGKPIAMTVNFRSGARIWCFKTAYRGDLCRYGPGALLEYEATLAALVDPTIEWLDACTADDSGLMGLLWEDRRPVVDMLISTRPRFNPAVRSAAMGWRAYLAGKRRVAALRNRKGARKS